MSFDRIFSNKLFVYVFNHILGSKHVWVNANKVVNSEVNVFFSIKRSKKTWHTINKRTANCYQVLAVYEAITLSTSCNCYFVDTLYCYNTTGEFEYNSSIR